MWRPSGILPSGVGLPIWNDIVPLIQGKELYYQTTDNRIMAVAVAIQAGPDRIRHEPAVSLILP